MRWAILGAGGVGSYFGGRLAAAGQDVTLVARGEHLAALRRDGLRMEDPVGRVEIFPIRATGDTVEVGQVDVVLLGVKTWQLAGALPALRPLISAGTVVVTAQNGVEAPEEVAATVGRDAVVPGMVKIFANLDGPGRVRHVGGPASLTFGEWDGGSSQRVATIRAELADAGITAIATDDVWMQLWSKFLFVVPFGGLGTLLDLPIGELRAGPRTRRLLADCMQEIPRGCCGRGRAAAVGRGPRHARLHRPAARRRNLLAAPRQPGWPPVRTRGVDRRRRPSRRPHRRRDSTARSGVRGARPARRPARSCALIPLQVPPDDRLQHDGVVFDLRARPVPGHSAVRTRPPTSPATGPGRAIAPRMRSVPADDGLVLPSGHGR